MTRRRRSCCASPAAAGCAACADPERRGRIVRPLLRARKATLRAALDEAGIAYATDPSNADLAHSRNRVRADLLPALERLNPAAVEALTRFGRLAADDDDLLDALAAAELAQRRNARTGPSTGTGRRAAPSAGGSCAWPLAIRLPPPSAWRRSSTRQRDRAAASRSSSAAAGAHRSGGG